MLKPTLLLATLFLSVFVLGQTDVKEWDKALKDSIKGKLKKIAVGNLSNGIATFYFKSDKSVFSVEKREQYKTNRHYDSSYSFSANFRNDTVFRMVIRRSAHLEKQGRVVIYLDGDKVLVQDIDGKVFIPEISTMLNEAYKLLIKAKELVNTKYL